MRAAGNLAGVEFIAPPIYDRNAEQWREIITESGYFFTGAWLFITSERYDSEPRRYTLHTWTKDGGIDTLGDFQEHATATAARRALGQRIGETANH
jgi:hypothetical protein